MTHNIMVNHNSASALKAFLEQEGLGMQKKFGQNFLINPGVRQALADALAGRAGDEAWEIGPGLGAMTALLLEKGLKVKAFEIDFGFIRVLKRFFSNNENFCLVEGDVMKTWSGEEPPAGSFTGAPFLLGNLPYNIAAALLADFIEKGRVFSRMVVVVQKEIAMRMTARAGSPDYSSFSVMCAGSYKAAHLMLIKRASFYPQPNVDSTGVLLESKNVQAFPAVFYPLVRALFSSRRKTIKNNLLTFLSSGWSKFRAMGIDCGVQCTVQELCAAILRENAVKENERAENLEFEAFLSLAKSIDNMRIYKQEC